MSKYTYEEKTFQVLKIRDWFFKTFLVMTDIHQNQCQKSAHSELFLRQDDALRRIFGYEKE